MWSWLTNRVDFDAAKVKPLQRVIDQQVAFDDTQLQFFKWIANYYLAPLGLVIQTALPSEIRARVLSVLRATEEGIEGLTRGEIPMTSPQCCVRSFHDQI